MVFIDKINPLNVLGYREVQDPPPYFHYVYVDLKHTTTKPIRDWIYENLKHRFYMNESLVLENNQFNIRLKIGFEEPKEASFFLLACPVLRHVNL